MGSPGLDRKRIGKDSDSHNCHIFLYCAWRACGLDATAYMSADELADVKTQMDLLDWNETFVQACFAKTDDEVKSIIESFRDQLKAAGIDRFEEYVKNKYEEDPNTVSFYK